MDEFIVYAMAAAEQAVSDAGLEALRTRRIASAPAS